VGVEPLDVARAVAGRAAAALTAYGELGLL
jgi:hypothetical protein